MTSEEVADMQLTRVIEARLERDAQVDQAFQDRMERLPSSQSNAIKEARSDKVAKVREDDTGLDISLRHALLKEVNNECRARGIQPDHIPPEKALEIGSAAFELCSEYKNLMSQRDGFTEVVDRDEIANGKDAFIKEQTLGQRDKLTANDVLSSAQTQGLEQEGRSTSARITPSLGDLQGPPRTLSKHQLLYELSTPDTKAQIEDIRQTTADARKAEFSAFNDPRVREERINKAMKDFASKPEIVNKMDGGPEQKFISADKVRAKATQYVHGEHRQAIAQTYADEQRGIREALDKDPNNLARFRSREQTLDPRTNSKESREIAVARVEERREKQRELTREFNQKTDPLER